MALVAWWMLYLRFFTVRFLFSMESFTLFFIYSTSLGSSAEFCISWCSCAYFC